MPDSIVIALIGIGGAIVGSVGTVAVRLLDHHLQVCDAAKRDEPRRRFLTKMLENPEYQWRDFATLMHVIGADEETTKRLLLEIGARASEDGKNLWGLLTRNPLP